MVGWYGNMEISRIVNGIIKYLDREIFPHMNDWQEMLARIAVSRYTGDSAKLKNTIISNPFLRTFAIIDESGNVDIDTLLKDVREQIAKKGKLELNIPMFGNFGFTPDELSEISQDQISKAIDEAYLKFDSYIDENFRV